jgi:surfeit locus 1 family protein
MDRTPSKARAAAVLALLAAAFAVLMGLGTWQVQRLQWKESLLATIEARAERPPASVADLHARIPEDGALEYTPVTVRGSFLHEREMFFLATHGGQSGWFVYTPLVLAPDESHASGDTVIVNRGFVPYDRRDPTTRPGSQPEGIVAVTGLAREALSEKPGFIVPDNRPQERIFYWKDWFAMVENAGLEADTTIPYFIDAGPSPSGTLPVGGVTIIDLPNNHLQYAVTWYGLAAALLAVVGAWFWRRRS